MSNKYKIYHISVIAMYTGATYYNAFHVIVPKIDEFKGFHAFGGLSKYLTFWNMIVQTVFFWVCFANDFIGTNELNPKRIPVIRKFKDFFFCTIAFPLSAFVAATFWGLYAVDRELVLPKILDPYFPTWLNHVLHTNIIIFTMVELISSFRIYPPRKKGLLTLVSFMACYLVWMLVVYTQSGQWVYPILTVLNWPQRIAFFLGSLFLIQGFYLFGEMINKMVWGHQFQIIARRQQDRKRT